MVGETIPGTERDGVKPTPAAIDTGTMAPGLNPRWFGGHGLAAEELAGLMRSVDNLPI